jgi:hypothetical protein
MVEIDLQPVVGRGMTSFTGGCRCNMTRMFTRGSHAIMARLTTSGNTIMIEVADIPTVGCMAGVTGCISQHMGR